MGRDAVDLPDLVDDLRALVLSQRVLLEEKEALADQRAAVIEDKQSLLEERSDRIDALEEIIRLLRSQRFAPKSEKAPVNQLGLFNEAEAGIHETETGEGEEEIDVLPPQAA
jgi:hypothetical protein